jgi:type IV pilus assembly protein PilW
MQIKASENGFTLIELLIAMAIGVVVVTGAILVFLSIQSTSKTIDLRTNMSMNARNTMYLIENEIRLMGFNPANDIAPNEIMDLSDGCCALGGFLTFNRNDPDDLDEVQQVSIGLDPADDSDGGRDGFVDAGATSVVRRVVDDDSDVRGDLAEDVVALRFAYAFDDDQDGNVDLSANDFILWAIDSDNDGELDTLLDTNDDGQINAGDTVGGAAMANTVEVSRIKAVKVWLLVRSSYPVGGGADTGTFVVADQRFTPNDDFAYTLLTTTIRNRNMI